MFNVHKESFEWGGRTLTLETGKIARQADGSVLATYGETIVLATVVGAPNPKEGVDFFPLTVNYQERYYAAGKIPGGYFKRERAPSERETLTSRALSATRSIAPIPFRRRAAAPRVGYINGEYVLNPLIDTYPESKLDLVVAGTHDAVMMVESEAQELSEDVMLGAVVFGHKEMQTAINGIIRLAEKSAKDPRPVPEDAHVALRERLTTAASPELAKAFQIDDKHERRDAISAVRKSLAATHVGEGEGKVAANIFSGL